MEQVSIANSKIHVINPGHIDLGLDFSYVLDLIGLWNTTRLFDSLEMSGIVCPLVAVDTDLSTRKGSLKLIDGFKRLEWARQKDLEKIPVATVHMTNMDLLVFFLSKYAPMLKSCVSKALFLRFLLKVGANRQAVVDKAMKSLGLQAHKGLLEKYLRIAQLPERFLAFCHKKDFSLKRCLNFTYQPRALLERIMDLEGQISLSASLLQEVCDSISEIIRRKEIDVEEFFQLDEIKGIIDSDLECSYKTGLLRQAIRRLRYPAVTRIQKELCDIEKQYLASLPFKVKWDETLENRKLIITASIKQIDEFSRLRASFSSPEAKEGIKRLLSYF